LGTPVKGGNDDGGRKADRPKGSAINKGRGRGMGIGGYILPSKQVGDYRGERGG